MFFIPHRRQFYASHVVSLAESEGKTSSGALCRYCIFFLIKESEAHGKSVRASFTAAHAHLVSESHFGNCPKVSSWFIITFVMVICDRDL